LKSPPRISPKTPVEKLLIKSPSSVGPGRRHLRDIQSAYDIHDYLRDVASAGLPAEPLETQLAALSREAAMLYMLYNSAGAPEEVLLVADLLVRQFGGGMQLTLLWDWIARIGEVFAELGYACQSYSDFGTPAIRHGVLMSGPGIGKLAEMEEGVHVACRWHENLVPVQVSLLPVGEGSLQQQVEAYYERRRTWLGELAAGQTRPETDPLRLGRIVRFYEEHATLDLRSGQTAQGLPSIDERKSMLLAGLPLPPELEES
jgi:hypothetical protein